MSLILGRFPSLIWRAPSASMPPATPLTILATREKRLIRDFGTAFSMLCLFFSVILSGYGMLADQLFLHRCRFSVCLRLGGILRL